MFGKDAHANEQVSEDEDWGPANKRRREKESDAASTLITLYEGKKRLPNVEAKQKIPLDPQSKKPFSRIPLDAVEVIGIIVFRRIILFRPCFDHKQSVIYLSYCIFSFSMNCTRSFAKHSGRMNSPLEM